MPAQARGRIVAVLTVVALLVSGLSASAARSGSNAQPSHSQRVAPAAAPGAPSIVGVSARGLGALVAWTPADIHDSVSGFTVAASAMTISGVTVPTHCQSPPSVSAPGTDSSALLAGLCAGVAYTATVTASNGSGAGPASDPSNPFVPLAAQAPAAPLITSVFGRDGALLVAWTAPDDTGGSAVTGYTLKATHDTTTVTVTPGASAASATVGGLTNGLTYQLSLVADNAIGTSTASTSSGKPHKAAKPGPPTALTVVPGLPGTLQVTWQAPLDDGGSTIFKYRVDTQQVVAQTDGNGNTVYVPKAGTTPIVIGTTGTSVTVRNLALAGALYQVQVRAVNSMGGGKPARGGTPSGASTNLTAQTVVLTPATLDALGSWNGTTLDWPAPAPAQVRTLQVGDVLLGASSAHTPNGLLAKVERDQPGRRCLPTHDDCRLAVGRVHRPEREHELLTRRALVRVVRHRHAGRPGRASRRRAGEGEGRCVRGVGDHARPRQQ